MGSALLDVIQANFLDVPYLDVNFCAAGGTTWSAVN